MRGPIHPGHPPTSWEGLSRFIMRTFQRTRVNTLDLDTLLLTRDVCPNSPASPVYLGGSGIEVPCNTVFRKMTVAVQETSATTSTVQVDLKNMTKGSTIFTTTITGSSVAGTWHTVVVSTVSTAQAENLEEGDKWRVEVTGSVASGNPFENLTVALDLEKFADRLR